MLYAASFASPCSVELDQFVCHHNTMFIYQSIETPTLDRFVTQAPGFPLVDRVYRFNAVTHASTGMSLVCCLLMAVTGYVVFTDKTQVPSFYTRGIVSYAGLG